MSSFHYFIARPAEGSIWVYGGGFLAWLVLRPITGDRLLLVYYASCLGIWLFSPLLIAWPWVLLKRRRALAALLVVPTALFLWSYSPSFLPRFTPPPSPNEPVTILTFNLGHTNTRTGALAATLIASQADVLALQEVTPFHRQSLDPVLANSYSHHFYYAPAGLAVYSRYPVLTEDILPIGPSSAQSVVIQVKETPFHLINAHLSQVGILRFFRTGDVNPLLESATARETQVIQILDAIRKGGLPAIVACDCNMTDMTAAYDLVTATLQDAYEERGWGLGHTFLIPRGFDIPSDVNLPVERVDYLLHSPEIGITKIRVHSSESGSDHFPLLAQFDLKP